jgi:hypothetical protein
LFANQGHGASSGESITTSRPLYALDSPNNEDEGGDLTIEAGICDGDTGVSVHMVFLSFHVYDDTVTSGQTDRMSTGTCLLHSR